MATVVVPEQPRGNEPDNFIYLLIVIFGSLIGVSAGVAIWAYFKKFRKQWKGPYKRRLVVPWDQKQANIQQKSDSGPDIVVPEIVLDDNSSTGATLLADDKPLLPDLPRDVKRMGSVSLSKAGDYLIPFEAIRQVQKLGIGSFGLAMLCKWNDQNVVMKDRNVVTEGQKISQYIEMQDEVRGLHALFPHQNVVHYLGISVTEGCPACTIEPYYPMGTFDVFLQNSDHISVSELLTMCHGVVEGMIFLAMNSITHGFLAARNVVVDDAPTGPFLRINDYGFTKQFSKANQLELSHTWMRWQAPEQLWPRPIRVSASDVYSFGVLLWEVFTRAATIPYEHYPSSYVGHAIIEGERLLLPRQTSRDFIKLIVKCWHSNWKDRPTWSEVQRTMIEAEQKLRFDKFPAFPQYVPGRQRTQARVPSPASKGCDPNDMFDRYGTRMPSPQRIPVPSRMSPGRSGMSPRDTYPESSSISAPTAVQYAAYRYPSHADYRAASGPGRSPMEMAPKHPRYPTATAFY